MKIIIEKQWHKWAFRLAIILALTSWIISIHYWPELPQIIPTHFGFGGHADAFSNKSIWYTFLIPAIQTVILAGFSVLYLKPKYANMPTTLMLDALDTPKRDYAFGLIRTMLAVTLVLMGVFFAYLTFAMNYSALHSKPELTPWAIVVWLVVLFSWLISYNVKVYRVTKQFIAESKKQ